MSDRFGSKALVRNFVTSRVAWLRKLLDPRRDIMAECGHPETILTEDYASIYKRGDVARRIVRIYPEESWSESPEIVENETDDETAFEKKWKEIEDEYKVWHYLQRADILSGIGRFGVLLIGVDDGQEMSEPLEIRSEGATAATERKLLYLRPFQEKHVKIATTQNDPTNERYGLPEKYTIYFADTGTGLQDQTSKTTAQSLTVHWTRVIHLADNRSDSDVYGDPRMECVWNRLLDLRKIAGGSGEMFWKGGFPGLSIEAANPDEDVEFDADATEEMMDKYMNGLQRYISLIGMQAKSLAPQVANPTPHVEVQLKLIAAAWGIPWRVFIGSEQSQLASGQDMIAWNRRITRRREEYLSPFVVRPVIDRFQDVGILPRVESYDIKWNDLNAPTEEEKATVAEKKTNALSKYVNSGMDAVIPPFQYLTMILDFSDEEAKGIIEEAGDRLEELTPDFADEREMRKMEARSQKNPQPPQFGNE